MIRKKVLIAFGLFIATGLILSAASRWTDIVFWGSKPEPSEKTSVWISAGWLRLARTTRTAPFSFKQSLEQAIARQRGTVRDPDRADYFLLRWRVARWSMPERYAAPDEVVHRATIVHEYSIRLWLICVAMTLPLSLFWWRDHRRHRLSR